MACYLVCILSTGEKVMKNVKKILEDANSAHIEFMRSSDIEYRGVKLLESLMYTGVLILNNEFLSNAELENE